MYIYCLYIYIYIYIYLYIYIYILCTYVHMQVNKPSLYNASFKNASFKLNCESAYQFALLILLVLLSLVKFMKRLFCFNLLLFTRIRNFIRSTVYFGPMIASCCTYYY